MALHRHLRPVANSRSSTQTRHDTEGHPHTRIGASAGRLVRKRAEPSVAWRISDQVAVEFATEASPADSLGDAAVGVPSLADQNAARGARYYQPRPTPAVKTVKPEDLELMRRLHEMRDASDLILQFGPYKGTTLAQVAMSHPEYVRQLMTRAQRPEVRAAAGRLVEAMDAAAEHKRKTGRGASRRGRSPI